MIGKLIIKESRDGYKIVIATIELAGQGEIAAEVYCKYEIVDNKIPCQSIEFMHAEPFVKLNAMNIVSLKFNNIEVV